MKKIVYIYYYLEFLPLNGSLPDMTSSTDNYIELQSIYHEQSLIDEEDIKKRTIKHLQECGLPANKIPDSDYTLFRQNVIQISVLSTSAITDEIELKNPKDCFECEFYDGIECNNVPLYWYILLRGCDLYLLKYGKYPDCNDVKITDFQDMCQELAIKYNPCIKISEEDIKEMY